MAPYKHNLLLHFEASEERHQEYANVVGYVDELCELREMASDVKCVGLRCLKVTRHDRRGSPRPRQMSKALDICCLSNTDTDNSQARQRA